MIEKETYFLVNGKSEEVIFLGTLKECEEEAKSFKSRKENNKDMPLKIFHKISKITFIKKV